MASTSARLKEAGYRVGQIIVLGVAVFVFGPWLHSAAPWLGIVGSEIIAIVFAAILTEALVLVAVLPTILHLDWQNESNPNPLREVVLSTADLNDGRARFEIAVRVEPGGALNRWLFVRAQRRGLSMRLEFPAAPIYFTVNLSTPVREVGKSVAEVRRGSYGVDILLDSPPSTGTWSWAKVLLQPVPPITSVTNSDFPLRLTLQASGKFGRLCAKVIRVRPSAAMLTLHR